MDIRTIFAFILALVGIAGFIGLVLTGEREDALLLFSLASSCATYILGLHSSPHTSDSE